MGGKPTFFPKKFKRTKFGNGEAIRNQAGAVISKTRVTATCQKNWSLIWANWKLGQKHAKNDMVRGDEKKIFSTKLRSNAHMGEWREPEKCTREKIRPQCELIHQSALSRSLIWVSPYAKLPRNLCLGHSIVVRIDLYVQISNASPREFRGS